MKQQLFSFARYFFKCHGFKLPKHCTYIMHIAWHISLSLLFGILGIVICNIKYNKCCVGYGSPQHIKYFASFSAMSFIVMYVIFYVFTKINRTNHICQVKLRHQHQIKLKPKPCLLILQDLILQSRIKQ